MGQIYRRYALGVVGVVCLVSGCGITSFIGSHPSYTIFKHVPAAQVAEIKQDIEQADVKHLELPTKLPYIVTAAHCPTPTSDPGPIRNISIFLGGATRALGIEASSDPSNEPVSEQNIEMMNEQVTELSNGIKALYGNNGNVSQLAWTQNHVLYFLSSSTNENKSDLTEKQLIQVADSFQ